MHLEESDILNGRVGFDVCARGRPSKFFVTHVHRDHLPAVEGATILTPPTIYGEVKRKYDKRKISVEVVRHSDVRRTFHRFKNSKTNRYDRVDTYCHFLDDEFVLIPESNEAWELIDEFAGEYRGIFYRQPSAHHIEVPPRREDLPEGWFYANNLEQKAYADNVIPKAVPSFRDGGVISI